jgi:hypothetical protein
MPKTSEEQSAVILEASSRQKVAQELGSKLKHLEDELSKMNSEVNDRSDAFFCLFVNSFPLLSLVSSHRQTDPDV